MVSSLQRQQSSIASQQPMFSVKETMLGKVEAVNINNNNNNKYSNSKNVNLCTKYYPWTVTLHSFIIIRYTTHIRICFPWHEYKQKWKRVTESHHSSHKKVGNTLPYNFVLLYLLNEQISSSLTCVSELKSPWLTHGGLSKARCAVNTRSQDRGFKYKCYLWMFSPICTHKNISITHKLAHPSARLAASHKTPPIN